MAAMDFSLRRDDRGMSVFWMILIMGAGVFGLLALVMVLTNSGGEEVEYGDGVEIMVNEGETTVTGNANSQASSNDTDDSFTGGTVTVDGPTPEGDLSTESIDVEVTPGEPAATAPVSDEGIEGVGGGVNTDQEDVVVDPDGTTAPVVPTPSGPEGSDDRPLTVD